MKKILIIFYLLLNLFVLSKELTFVQVSDTHILNDSTKLEKLVEEINQLKDIDFVFFTGDNIDKTTPKSLYLFLSTIKNIKYKTYVLIGNHDVAKSSGLDKKQYFKTTRAFLGHYHPIKPHYIVKKDKFVFIALDGVKEIFPATNGYYKKDELTWLDKNLEKYKDYKVVILQHFPILDSTKDMTINLYNKEEYLKVLNKYNNVVAIVSGHYHYNQEEKIDNVYNIVTPSFKKNNVFKIIKLYDDDDFVYTSLITIED